MKLWYRNMALPMGTLLVASSVLMGCAVLPDRRLTSDEQSCRSMGHSPDTTAFKQCMADLDNRRCAVAHAKGGAERHLPSESCTRLN